MSLVLIPAYEPDDRLVALVTSLLPQYPVLVVDDGSGPDYAAVFSECARAGARVVHHTHNRGKGAALRTGFSIAERDLAGEDVVTADADGQHTPADIAYLVADAAFVGDTLFMPDYGTARRFPRRRRAHPLSVHPTAAEPARSNPPVSLSRL